MMSLCDWTKAKLQSLLVLINCKWQSGGNAAMRERERDNQRTVLEKAKQIEKHNEERTESRRKCNLQRTEEKTSLSEMDLVAVWEGEWKKNPAHTAGFFCPNIF